MMSEKKARNTPEYAFSSQNAKSYNDNISRTVSILKLKLEAQPGSGGVNSKIQN